MKAARQATNAYFLLMGVAIASWASRIPDIQEALALSPGTLGLVLLGMPAGSILSLVPAGWLSAKYGSRWVLLGASLLYVFALWSIAQASSAVGLAGSLFLFGIGGDLINIAANTQAVAVQKVYGRPIMSSFHAVFGVGTFLGAALGGLTVRAGMDVSTHFFGVVLMGLAIAFLANFWLLREEPTPPGPLFAWPDKALMLMGFIAFCCMMTEGAMADWSSLYYKQMGGTIAATGYTVFTFTMTTGRFLGDFLTERLGVGSLLKISALLVVFGLGLVIAFPVPTYILLGFGLVGFGVAVVVPLAYSEAGRAITMPPALALAAVSTIAYTGFLLGPVLIGFIAEMSSLRAALGLILGLGIVSFVLSGKLK